MTTDTDTPPARTRSNAGDPIMATLEGGAHYSVKFNDTIERFENGKPRAVSPALKAYLQKTAIDQVNVSGRKGRVTGEPRQKFTFE